MTEYNTAVSTQDAIQINSLASKHSLLQCLSMIRQLQAGNHNSSLSLYSPNTKFIKQAAG